MLYYTIFQACPLGWINIYISCNQLVAKREGYLESINTCRVLGGRLAIVSSEAEMRAIQQHMKDVNLLKVIAWVDGTDAAKEGVWLTEGGNPLPYRGFTGRNPDGGERENCIGVNPRAVLDIVCTESGLVSLSICELI